MKLKPSQIKRDLELLAKIRKYAFDNVSCTAGVYCENLQIIRGILNASNKKH